MEQGCKNMVRDVEIDPTKAVEECECQPKINLEDKLRIPPNPEEETKEGLTHRLHRADRGLHKENVPHVDIPELPEADLGEIMEDLSKSMPEYKRLADYYANFNKGGRVTLFDSCELDPALLEQLNVLAGVDGGFEITAKEKGVSLRNELIDAVLDRSMPKGLNIMITEESVLVNGVPTKISGKSVENLFLGLLDLEGKESAVKKTAKVLRKKLSKLF